MALFSSRKFRPLMTLVFVAAGAYAGSIVANSYFRVLAKYLRGESADFLWFIPQNPTHLGRPDRIWLGILFVVVGALLAFVFERLTFLQVQRTRSRWESMDPHERLLFIAGLVLGLVLTALLRTILGIPNWATFLLAVLLCYLSVAALQSLAEQVRFYFPPAARPGAAEDKHKNRPKLLDTNVIIDGRIADICRAGFMEGPIYLPGFVLEELQQIADSADSLKRARGRRGLDILNQMQKEMDLQVPQYALDPSEEVDARLVKAAKQVGGAIVTNDYNLNKVARLHGVGVINLNDVANALKPVFLPGEHVDVRLIKPGEEAGQGVGYLEDGTMVVVEGGREHLNELVQISVTSVLQTSAGRMVFGRYEASRQQTPSRQA